MGPFWGMLIHENTCSKTKFKSKGAECFWAPLNLQLNCAYDQDRVDWNYQTYKGWTAAICAVYKNHVESVRILLTIQRDS